MNKENSFTPEQLTDMVKSLTSNARIGQFIVENHGTVNYNEKEAAPPDDRHMRQVLQELMEAKDELSPADVRLRPRYGAVGHGQGDPCLQA